MVERQVVIITNYAPDEIKIKSEYDKGFEVLRIDVELKSKRRKK